MLYSFYRTYTNIFIIFGSAHDLLHKIKHKTKFLHKKKRERPLYRERPGTRPAGRPTCPRPKRALRALASTHGVADSGPPLSASSSSFGRPKQRRDRAIRAISAPRDSLVAISTPWRTSGPPNYLLSPSLAPNATGAADGRLGRANAGRYER